MMLVQSADGDFGVVGRATTTPGGVIADAPDALASIVTDDVDMPNLADLLRFGGTIELQMQLAEMLPLMPLKVHLLVRPPMRRRRACGRKQSSVKSCGDLIVLLRMTTMMLLNGLKFITTGSCYAAADAMRRRVSG